MLKMIYLIFISFLCWCTCTIYVQCFNEKYRIWLIFAATKFVISSVLFVGCAPCFLLRCLRLEKDRKSKFSSVSRVVSPLNLQTGSYTANVPTDSRGAPSSCAGETDWLEMDQQLRFWINWSLDDESRKTVAKKNFGPDSNSMMVEK